MFRLCKKYHKRKLDYMNYTATWIYLDKKGEETDFPQTGKLSSSFEHQALYWRCVYIFFKFARKYLNYSNSKFLLFTNYVDNHLIIDGVDIIDELKKMDVQIIVRDFTFKLPKNYYGSWGNQLYEFDILDEFSKLFENDSRLLMLDSDCLITQDISELFSDLDNTPAITFRGEYKNIDETELINGISEKDMLDLSNEYIITKGENIKLDKVPYLCGEFFCARYDFIKQIVDEFPELWKFMIQKFENEPVSEAKKFNEEAHFLSYFYAKNNIPVGIADAYIKRLWTSDNYYQIKEGDENIAIWHVLSGKRRYEKIFANIDSLLKKDDKFIIEKIKSLFFTKNSIFDKKNNGMKSVLKHILRKLHLFDFVKSLVKK